MKFSICNLGCKVNAYEAESIAHTMEQKGWERVDFEQPADATMIFTCAVTNMAAQKSRKMMHRAKRLSPEGIVAMVGCYAEVDQGLLEEAEIVVGTKEKKRLPEFIDQYLATGEKIRVKGDLQEAVFDVMETNSFENKSRAYLKIQDGCNQFCSYCVIPYARGRERSMAPDEVISSMKVLAEQYPEVVLTGIHTGRYGREFKVSLTDIMKRILKEVPQLYRLRISSIEVTELDDDFVAFMKEEPRIARHLHIPLQSGCDSVLQRMHRPYTTQEYYEKIEKIREEIPDVSISCDLIVGFPQETEKEFEETYAFLQKCRFSFLHVFPYSMRNGTVAADMPCQIDPQIKKQRAQKCIALSGKLYDTYQSQWIGKEADVIVEQCKEEGSKGHSSQYIPVTIAENLTPKGIYRVKVNRYENHQLFGSVIEKRVYEAE